MLSKATSYIADDDVVVARKQNMLSESGLICRWDARRLRGLAGLQKVAVNIGSTQGAYQGRDTRTEKLTLSSVIGHWSTVGSIELRTLTFAATWSSGDV